MALKDWKKSKLGKTYFENPITETQIFYNKEHNNMWVVYIRRNSVSSLISGLKIISPQFFKTKSQALRFAKSYMRTH